MIALIIRYYTAISQLLLPGSDLQLPMDRATSMPGSLATGMRIGRIVNLQLDKEIGSPGERAVVSQISQERIQPGPQALFCVIRGIFHIVQTCHNFRNRIEEVSKSNLPERSRILGS